ncbi:branched-chain alpha-keto acid dehydrogenase subunit E2 [Gammaproteobacteria bacterium 53_120_T64]|nr:branched-chain alpha-keto acid dehydrogenase subunit E2 [Gammaproteobacteria bacterium 53_120_T64]
MEFYSFKLPDLGEGIVESEIDVWHVSLGETVDEDQHIADVITDKAVVEITAPVSGTVAALACNVGEVLAVGQELIRFNVVANGNITNAASNNMTNTASCTTLAGVEQQTAPIARASSSEPVADLLGESANTGASIPITSETSHLALPHRTLLTSPSLRRRARQVGIDLSLVPGSGPNGRIREKDFDAYMAVTQAPSHQGKRLACDEVPIRGLRRIIGQKMLQAKRQIPHYSYIEEVDVSALEELRQHLNTTRHESQAKLTLLPFIMQALTKVLPQFPHCNAHFDQENDLLKQHQAVHIGIATMTKAGLMVPVVRHCESLDIWQSAREVARVSRAAREGKSKNSELSGSTITLTSLGAIGGLATTPIINAPETSIIGINKIQQRPVVKDGAIVIRRMMNLSSSFDHRIVDGFDGAELIQAIKTLLENPATIFL